MGDGGDGIGRAWVVKVIFQVIVRAGKESPRRAWIFFVRVGPLEVLLRPILPAVGRWGRAPLSGTKVGALRRKDKPLAAIWAAASQSGSWFGMVFIGNPRSETNREGGDRIVLRSKHSNLNLRHTYSILSINIYISLVTLVSLSQPLWRGVTHIYRGRFLLFNF